MSLPPPTPQRHPDSVTVCFGVHLTLSGADGQGSTMVQVSCLALSHVYFVFLRQDADTGFNFSNMHIQILHLLFWLCQGCMLCHQRVQTVSSLSVPSCSLDKVHVSCADRRQVILQATQPIKLFFPPQGFMTSSPQQSQSPIHAL